MAPSISVHEGDSYDPNGPLADLDRKVTVTTDEPHELMTEEERAATTSGVSVETLRKAQADYEDGTGPQNVDLREFNDEDREYEVDGDDISTPRSPGEDTPSAGTSSSGSSTKPGKTTSGTKNETGNPSSALTTDGLSTKGQKASSTAPSEGTSSVRSATN